MDYALLLLNGLLFGLQTICWKIFSQNHLKSRAGFFLFNAMCFPVCVAVFCLFFGVSFAFDGPTMIIGAAFGILFVFTTLFYLKSMDAGPLSYSSLLFSFGIVIPVAAGILFLHERVTVFRAIGLLLIVPVIYLSSGQERDQGRKRANLRWLLWATAAFVGNGILMVLMKAHQTLLPGRSVGEFLVVSFSTAALVSLGCYSFHAAKGADGAAHFKGIMPVVAGAGLTTAFGNILAATLASRVPSIVQFPTVSLGTILVSTIFSGIFLKEKLDLRKCIVLIVGIAALFFINIS